jgi:hypothetical protein
MVSASHAAFAAPRNHENGAGTCYIVDARAGMRPVSTWCLRARVSVWPGHRHAPETVAAPPSRARRADCLLLRCPSGAFAPSFYEASPRCVIPLFPTPLHPFPCDEAVDGSFIPIEDFQSSLHAAFAAPRDHENGPGFGYLGG